MKADFLLPAWTLWQREVVRFLRQRSRVVGALGTPIVFWMVVGSGLRNSFQLGGASTGASGSNMNYMQYAFAGTIVMIVLFTAIFSMISVIEDRREGFLQAVIAAPVRRGSIVLGKVLGSTTLAVGQSLLFLLLAPFCGVPLSLTTVAVLIGVLIVVGLGLSALGFLIAWPMESTQGFHAIMNLFLLPMWLLSGALFPAAGASGWIRWIMTLNPLTYGVAWVRYALHEGNDAAFAGLPSQAICATVTLVFAGVMIGLSSRIVGRHG